jgi:hypothetical protein
MQWMEYPPPPPPLAAGGAVGETMPPTSDERLEITAALRSALLAGDGAALRAAVARAEARGLHTEAASARARMDAKAGKAVPAAQPWHHTIDEQNMLEPSLENGEFWRGEGSWVRKSKSRRQREREREQEQEQERERERENGSFEAGALRSFEFPAATGIYTILATGGGALAITREGAFGETIMVGTATHEGDRIDATVVGQGQCSATLDGSGDLLAWSNGDAWTRMASADRMAPRRVFRERHELTKHALGAEVRRAEHEARVQGGARVPGMILVDDPAVDAQPRVVDGGPYAPAAAAQVSDRAGEQEPSFEEMSSFEQILVEEALGAEQRSRDNDVGRIVAMGFSEDQARSALLRAGGSLDGAVGLLLEPPASSLDADGQMPEHAGQEAGPQGLDERGLRKLQELWGVRLDETPGALSAAGDGARAAAPDGERPRRRLDTAAAARFVAHGLGVRPPVAPARLSDLTEPEDSNRIRSVLQEVGLVHHLDCLLENGFDMDSLQLCLKQDWVEIGIPPADGARILAQFQPNAAAPAQPPAASVAGSVDADDEEDNEAAYFA